MCIILFLLLFVCLFVRVLSFLCCVARRGITAHRRRIMYIMYSLVLWWGEKWVILCFVIVEIVMMITVVFVRIDFIVAIKIFLCLVGCAVRGVRNLVRDGRVVVH